ncbi:MAG: cation:proton antiporter [Rhodospirillaceae bacterium]|nr:cation:proton antiporter [Rhodospirillaceae bacterium]MYF87304.1 cation:proton antiporter [Rhodospirillaceae bacterium]MYH38208.1 cation:proton antiporter [Rhodospirillaceae bacterium]MYK13024.1 cation:proton antiporter [Rhodospirillaceae bacterium]
MHDGVELTGLALVGLIALAGGLLMVRMRQPVIVGYIVAGVVLGPSGFQLVEDRLSVAVLAELGVLMLLFLVGMELSLRGFKAIWKVAVGATLLQIAIAVGAMLLIGWVGDWPTPVVVVLGFVVALSSTAVVVKMLEQLDLLRQPVGQLTIGILIAQDLAVVPMLLTIGLFGDREPGLLDLAKILLSIGLLIAFILYLSRRRRLVLPFSAVAGAAPEILPLAALCFCFGAAALTGILGLSPVLGAFLAGLVVGNSTARAHMVRTTRPIQSVLMVVFFLSIGLLIDLNFIWENLGTVILLLVTVTVVKTAVNVGILRLLREPWPNALAAGILLAQIGEFSLVVSEVAQERAIITSESGQLIVAVIAFSLLMSPLWIAIARRLIRVIMLGVTSLRGTLQAVETRRTAALVRQLLALWATVVRVWRESRLTRRLRRRRTAEPPAVDEADAPALLPDRSAAPDAANRAGPDNA